MNFAALRARFPRGRSSTLRTLLMVGGVGVLCKATGLGRELLVGPTSSKRSARCLSSSAVIIPAVLVNVIGNVLARFRRATTPASPKRARASGRVCRAEGHVLVHRRTDGAGISSLARTMATAAFVPRVHVQVL